MRACGHDHRTVGIVHNGGEALDRMGDFQRNCNHAGLPHRQQPRDHLGVVTQCERHTITARGDRDQRVREPVGSGVEFAVAQVPGAAGHGGSFGMPRGVRFKGRDPRLFRVGECPGRRMARIFAGPGRDRRKGVHR
jgi:hypothetical protein